MGEGGAVEGEEVPIDRRGAHRVEGPRRLRVCACLVVRSEERRVGEEGSMRWSSEP